MEAKNILEQLNLQGKKADVYLASLEMGGATAYSIAKKIGLKRPTVYDILDQLLKEGLVYKSIKSQVSYFYPADPERILHFLKEKERNLESIMPYLQSLYNSPKIKPAIIYFEGRKGIQEMYQDSIKSLRRGDEILAYVGEDVLNYLPSHPLDYVKKRVEKGIRLKGIYKKTPEILKHMAKNREELRETKIIEEKYFPVNNETNIYLNKIAIASYGREMFGMIIESAEIARAQKAIFELAWNGCEKIKTP